MERLTERYKDSIANIVLITECGDKLCKDICDDIECNCSKCGLEKALEKLAEYEDLEEQGLLVRLPCKVGTEVYYILGIPNKTPCTIDKCVFKLSDIHKIGESLFLTREEAEKKLEEMRANA